MKNPCPFMFRAATLALAGLVPTMAWADAANTTAVVNAANAFKAGVSSAQQSFIDSDPSVSTLNSSVQYNFKLANVEVWSNLPVGTTASSVTRNGLIFSGLSDAQLTLEENVAVAALSTTGKKLMDDVRAGDRYISGEVTNDRGTTSSMWGYKKYFIAFVGTPSTSSPWTLQIGGHHLAYNITYNGTYTSATPLFAGTEPNSWTDSTGSYAPLGTQRTLLVALRQTLTTSALLSGTFSDVVFGANGSGPGTTQSHDTIQPKAYPTSGRGQLYSSLNSTQQGYVRSYIEDVVNKAAPSIAAELLAIYESPQALAETYVGYSGSSTTLSTNPSYVRVDGPRLWIEFSVQGGVYNPSGVHDHFLWRDKLADYGAAYGSTTIGTTARPPTIATQPISQTVAAGASATFTVSAASSGTGTTTLSYQWYKDGTAISGATSASYTISSTSAGDAGSYSVWVVSTGGLTTSSTATLTVGATASLSIVTGSTLSSGVVSTAYSATLTASGGTSPYTWTLAAGSLPAGLAISSAGVISGTPTETGTLSFTVQAADSAGATASKTFSLTITTASAAARLINVSSRARVETGDNVTIAGFVLSGTGTKRILVRGLGPSLASAVGGAVLANPTLTVYNSAGSVVGANDDWTSHVVTTTAPELAPSNSLESVVIFTAAAGSYTAILSGVSAGTGIGLVEVYDLDPSDTTTRLINLSTRARVQTGDNVLIGGIVVQGSGTRNFLIRGLGPSLATAGVSNVLADPVITLVDSTGATVATNDNWASASNAAAITATGLAPTSASESALLVNLSAGTYTVIVRGVNSTSGVGLVEFYEVQ